MKVACIVQARLGSTRLPNKVLLPLSDGLSVINQVLTRCLMIKGVDQVVAAIPDIDADDVLADHIAWNCPCGVTLFRGSHLDVLARYAAAADYVNADVIMRVTADCPLLDADVCADVLDLYRQDDSVVIAVNNAPRTWPHGFDCEVFSRSVLDSAAQLATDAYDREHVTPWIRRDYDVGNLRSPIDRSNVRLTLDTQEDYRRIYRDFKCMVAL